MIIDAIKNQNPDLTDEAIQQYMVPDVAINIQKKIDINPLFADKTADFMQSEWLADNEITFLIEQEIKKTIEPKFFNFSVFETSIKSLEQEKTGIPEIDVVSEKEIGDRRNLIEQNFKKDNYIYAFILNGASQASVRGHWATLVVNIVNGNVQYIILDSSNAPRYQTPPNLRYQNTPKYIGEKIMGPDEAIADHIYEIIALIENTRK